MLRNRYVRTCSVSTPSIWLKDSASFNKQLKPKLVTCPVCNSAQVEKAIMAPQIPSKGRTAGQRVIEQQAQTFRTRCKPDCVSPNTPEPAMADPLMMMAQEMQFITI